MAATQADSRRLPPPPLPPSSTKAASRRRRTGRGCHRDRHACGRGCLRRLAVTIAAAAVAAAVSAATAIGTAEQATFRPAVVTAASTATGTATGTAASLLRPPGAPAHPLPRPAPPAAPSRFGAAACLSPDGTTLAVGAPSTAAYRGAVWVYSRRLRARRWTASVPVVTADTGADADAGAVVWGTPVAVSLPGTDAAEANRPAGSLTPPVRGSAAGYACAWTAGGGLAVGAPGHESGRGGVWVVPAPPQRGWAAGAGAGAVATALPLPDDSRSGDAVGSAIAGDGDVLAVGARGVRGHHGRVVVYEHVRAGDGGNGGSSGSGGESSAGGSDSGSNGWGAPVTLSPPDWTDEPGPGGVRIRNNFGVAVAVGAHGTLIAVGSTGYRTERGAVYLYERATSVAARGGGTARGSWTCVQRLVSGDPSAYGFFGWKVAVGSGVGSAAVVAVGADGEDAYRGAVYVYERQARDDNVGSGSDGTAAPPSAAPGDPVDALAAGPYGLTASLRRAGGVAEDNFGGGGLALSASGDVLAVGAPGVAGADGRRDAGTVVVYHRRRHARREGAGGARGEEGARSREGGSGDTHEGGNGGWHAVVTHALSGPAALSASLFGWDVALSADGAVLVASSPDARGGEGLVWTALGGGGTKEGGGMTTVATTSAAAATTTFSAAATAVATAAASAAQRVATVATFAALRVADACAVAAAALTRWWAGVDAVADAVRAGASRLLAAVAKEEL
ncbi:hypothetical protein MMPV_003503 [Pyropia vietnamensis]